jgi:hypothetical protein
MTSALFPSLALSMKSSAFFCAFDLNSVFGLYLLKLGLDGASVDGLRGWPQSSLDITVLIRVGDCTLIAAKDEFLISGCHSEMVAQIN